MHPQLELAQAAAAESSEHVAACPADTEPGEPSEAITRAMPRPRLGSPDDRATTRTLLSSFELTAGLSEELIDALLARCVVIQVRSGEALITAGQLRQEMYVVLSGELRIHLGERLDLPVALAHAGDSVGEMCTLDRRPSSATVIAASNASLLVIDERMFWQLIHSSHAFCTRLLIKLVSRLRSNNDTVRANMELCAQLESVALTDALTGVSSRRWLDETLPRFCERSRRDRSALSVAMLDIDHFKSVNDRYGHQAGDVVLAAVAGAIRARLRPTDFVARFGGEEFTIILPNTPVAGACVAAERLREFIEHCSFNRPGLVLPDSITVSVGIAELQADDAHALLGRADAALYRAKQRGRNRVER